MEIYRHIFEKEFVISCEKGWNCEEKTDLNFSFRK